MKMLSNLKRHEIIQIGYIKVNIDFASPVFFIFQYHCRLSRDQSSLLTTHTGLLGGRRGG